LTLEALAEGLPNGFHDAEIHSILIDYTARRVTLKLSVWLGPVDAKAGSIETYRDAELSIDGTQVVVIDPPDPRYPYAKAEPLWVDLEHGSPETSIPVLDRVPPGSFRGRFFVRDWNSFISIVASTASLSWTGEPYVGADG